VPAPAEAQEQARQILRKILVGRIKVTPDDGSWTYVGRSRFESVIRGGLANREVAAQFRADRRGS
jgi:predicted RNA-binding Zn ribbon-like protein